MDNESCFDTILHNEFVEAPGSVALSGRLPVGGDGEAIRHGDAPSIPAIKMVIT